MQEMRKILVARLAVEKARWVVGGYENSVLDELMSEMPSVQEMVEEVYQEMITDSVMLTHKGVIKLTKDIRFLGKETLMMIASMAVLKTLE